MSTDLTLNLGWSFLSKKTKIDKKGKCAANGVFCQVDNCNADLSSSKAYLQRHKVCEVHSKARVAIVKGVEMRFCQQCSKFQEVYKFEKDKRSCRDRLAGHNERRRKDHSNLADEQNRCFARYFGNTMRNQESIQITDLDSSTQLLRNFHETDPNQETTALLIQQLMNKETQNPNFIEYQPMPSSSSSSMVQDSDHIVRLNMQSASQRQQLLDIDLNEPQVCVEEIQLIEDTNLARGSSQASSSSSRETQNCTDRILIKLFEKSPQDIPSDLYGQIITWLHNHPTEIESYIRPGCIILTIYLRLENYMWEELCNDLASALQRLVGSSRDSFWQRGWISLKIRQFISVVYNGVLMINGSFPRYAKCSIRLIKPIAVSVSKPAKFSVEGLNLCSSTSRLLCNMNGKCLVAKNCDKLVDGAKSGVTTKLSIRCRIPNITGRGFIEVEDEDVLGNFFPFIVAEAEVCSEIRTLETVIAANKGKSSQTEAMNFIHEMGWLLQRSNSPNLDHNLFPVNRFKWLINFALENDWCTVVKKLLDILSGGVVGTGNYSSVDEVLLDLCLLHKAVWRNCKDMVGLLLDYVVDPCRTCSQGFQYKPNQVDHLGMTPLHLAAINSGSEEVLHLLTEDCESVSLNLWNTAEDHMGHTPNDYATISHHESYIILIQNKLNGRKRPYILRILFNKTQCRSIPKTKTILKTPRRQCQLCQHRKRVSYRTTNPCLLPFILKLFWILLILGAFVAFVNFNWDVMIFGRC